MKQNAAPSSGTTITTTKKKTNNNNNNNNKRRKKGPQRLVPLVRAVGLAAGESRSSRSSANAKKRKLLPPSSSSSSNNGNGNVFSSTAESLQLIAQYHTLNKRLEQNARDETLSISQRETNALSIQQEQLDLGGIEKYQQASMFGAKSSKFVCAHWVEPLLRSKLQLSNTKNEAEVEVDVDATDKSKLNSKSTIGRPRILDVGAIDNQYLPFDWFDAVAIDLNSQHPSVVKADFFDYAHDHIVHNNKNKNNNNNKNNNQSNRSDENEKPLFDAVVLSLVLNFQGDPRKRGDMLALACDARILKPDGHGLLFVALPCASLDNSRYCDEAYFIQMATTTLNLQVVEIKRSAKLILMTFCTTSSNSSSSSSSSGDSSTGTSTKNKRSPKHVNYYNAKNKTFNYGKKEIGRAAAKSGAKKNNFAVMLKTSTKVVSR